MSTEVSLQALSNLRLVLHTAERDETFSFMPF